ncbi:hypothetical protein [Streptomyces sp. NPDC042319]|uniref:hypothetical protein n=1 Tax=Streptomyces sp. NPDC042319 TaxID=3154332 RepID=UPI0033F75A80
MTAVPPLWEDYEAPAHTRGGQVTLNLYDHLAAYAPKHPGAYLRISSDRLGLETGVDRQLKDAEDSRKRLGWGAFAKVYEENDTSAFKKRKIIRSDGTIDWIVLRPEFRQLLADLAAGVIDGVSSTTSTAVYSTPAISKTSSTSSSTSSDRSPAPPAVA